MRINEKEGEGGREGGREKERKRDIYTDRGKGKEGDTKAFGA